jgi:disease resistance protein
MAATMEKAGAVRCQRIGCDAMFTEADNPEDSCRYHPSV